MKPIRKYLSLLLCIALTLTLAGCGADGQTVTDTSSAETALESGTDASVPSTLQETTTTEKTTTQITVHTTEKQATEKETEAQQMPVSKGMKILSVGNSLSRDGMHYLPRLLAEAGYTDIVVAYLYVGGCSLEEHTENAKSNRKAYDYFENTGHGWSCKENVSLNYGLGAQKWDYVVLQQASRLSGVNSSYRYLDELISFVRNNTRSKPELLWHMTWAYEKGTELELFERYDYDQQKMYRQTLSCIKEHILTSPHISGVIPVGTAVQNARSTFIGDRITYDGRHMSRPLGRYLAGLVWFGYLTGCDVDSVKFNPDKTALDEKTVSAIKKSVKSALENPMK